MKKWLLCTLIIVAVVITGCTKPDSESDKAGYQEDPTIGIVKDELLLYQETDPSAGYGDLYIKSGTGDRQKLASDVLHNQFQYLYNTKTLLYMNKDYTLKAKVTGQEEELIASQVLPGSISISTDESSIIYLQSVQGDDVSGTVGDLYYKSFKGEKEKLASDIPISRYHLTEDGNVITYVDSEHSLYRQSAGQADKEKLASDVASFLANKDGSITIIRNTDGSTYLKRADSLEREKMTSHAISKSGFSQDNLAFAFLDEYRSNPAKGELILIKDGYEKTKIASDVTDYEFPARSNQIYYVNVDKSLYVQQIGDTDNAADKQANGEAVVKKIDSTAKTKLDDDVAAFQVAPDGSSIAYTDTDDNLFLKRAGEQKVRVGNNIAEFHLYNDSILFLDKDKTLYSIDLTLEGNAPKKDNEAETDRPASPVKEKIKLGDNIAAYYADESHRYLAYYTASGEVLLRTNKGDQPTKALDQVESFTHVYFLDLMLFENLLTLDDLVGYWKYTNSGNDGLTYFAFTSDSKFVIDDLQSEESSHPFEIQHATVRSADVSFSDEPSDRIRLELIDKDTFAVYEADDPAVQRLVRSTKEEFDKHHQSIAAAVESNVVEQTDNTTPSTPNVKNTAQTADDAVRIVEDLSPGDLTAFHDFSEYDVTTLDGAYYYFINYTSAEGMGGELFVQKGTGEVYGYTIGTEDDPNAPFPDFSNRIK